MTKKIKIIDLFCNIDCEEEVPKRILYGCNEYFYDKELNFYYTDTGISLYREMLTNGNCLNDEVEILDEEDEFEDILEWGKGALEENQTKNDFKIEDLAHYIYLLMETQNDLIKNQKKIIERLNEK